MLLVIILDIGFLRLVLVSYILSSKKMFSFASYVFDFAETMAIYPHSTFSALCDNQRLPCDVLKHSPLAEPSASL
jgi:hypothetical protein